MAGPLTRLVLDFETYYADDYSLRKQSPPMYVADPRFKAHGAAVKVNDEPAYWVSHDELPGFLASVDWPRTLYINHNNALFDGLILEGIYGYTPLYYIDTLCMARAVLGGAIKSKSLDSVGEHLGLGGKEFGGAALAACKGVRDLPPELERSLASYAIRDAELTAQVCEILGRQFPIGEIPVMDWVARMTTQPTLRLNAAHLYQCWQDEIARKERLAAEIGLDKTQIRSDQQFAGLLRASGVEPPTKVSRKTHKVTFAFAKTDQVFTDMADDESLSDYSRELVRARLGLKSSIEETRAKTYYEAAVLRGDLPAMLQFSGAQNTHRLSGSVWNLQNNSRNSPIKKGIEAPPGCGLVEADSSNIELRVVFMLAGMHDELARLAAGADLYSEFASGYFGVEVSKDVSPDLRQVGKVAMLSLQYGAGADTFRQMLWVQAKRRITRDEAQAVVNYYRAKYRKIKALWADLGQRLRDMASGRAPGELESCPALKWHADRIVLPSGLALKYPELRWRRDRFGARQALDAVNTDPVSWGLDQVPAVWAWIGEALEAFVDKGAPPANCAPEVDFLVQLCRLEAGMPASSAAVDADSLVSQGQVQKDVIEYAERTMRLLLARYPMKSQLSYKNLGDKDAPGGWKKIYGGLLTENLGQSLAREIITEQLMRINRTHMAALQVHDSGLWPVRLDQIQAAVNLVHREMSTPPSWWPGIPLACEVKVGPNYGELKRVK